MKILKNNGVTLIELVVTMTIIGVLSGIATPLYTNMTENSRRSEATTALAVIYLGEKLYASGNSGAYWAPSTPPTSPVVVSDVNTALNVDLAPLKYYDLSINTTTVDSVDCRGNPIASPAFLAMATRNNGSGTIFCADPTTGPEAPMIAGAGC